jgi:hypothetical protein
MLKLVILLLALIGVLCDSKALATLFTLKTFKDLAIASDAISIGTVIETKGVH